MRKGFSLIELLVTLVIVSILMLAVYYTYTSVVAKTKTSFESIELNIEKSIGLELLRLDLEHVGYGVAADADAKIIEWNEGSGPEDRSLTIRSVLNNTDSETIGWQLCSGGTPLLSLSTSSIVYVDITAETYAGLGAACPSASGIYVGFPYDGSATECEYSGTNVCSTIIYELSDSNLPSHCHPDTYNLLRKVNGGSGSPILSCVADFKVRFDLDEDGDGYVDCSGGTDICWVADLSSLGSTVADYNANVRSKLRNIHVYILAQESGKGRGIRYVGSGTFSVDETLTSNVVGLELPADHENFSWKIYKLTVNPTGMFGGLKVETE